MGSVCSAVLQHLYFIMPSMPLSPYASHHVHPAVPWSLLRSP